MTKSGKTKNIEQEITKNENCLSDISSGEVMSNENENDDDGDKGEDEEQAASRLFISSLLVHGNYKLSSSSCYSPTRFS